MFLPIVYRIWASARMVQLEEWFRSLVLNQVCSASSVEAWCPTAPDVEDVLSAAVDSDIHLFVAECYPVIWIGLK